MKALLVNKYHYIRGGSETYHFALAELLRKQGYEVIFFSMQDDKNFPCEQTDYFIPNIEYAGNPSLSQQLRMGKSRGAYDKI